jgi:hypothetical protein
MQTRSDPTDETSQAPVLFREALVELVQIGMRVARMVGRAADAEAALADAAMADGVLPVATSLAEAIAADEAACAAGEARQAGAARTEIVAAAFAQVSRAIRRTILLAERMDRGWARPVRADDRQAMARRQIVRAMGDAIARDPDAEEAERLDTLDDIGGRTAEDIIREICRDLKVDPAFVPSEVAARLAEWERSGRAPAPSATPQDRRPLDTSG